ncbi:hypothetical protein S40288_08648 [Stachybotrys chartarum IBT 40288]|nr:hypothetical protein S40288_08648 [Stachybotrys chartarum IBT 40288]
MSQQPQPETTRCGVFQKIDNGLPSVKRANQKACRVHPLPRQGQGADRLNTSQVLSAAEPCNLINTPSLLDGDHAANNTTTIDLQAANAGKAVATAGDLPLQERNIRIGWICTTTRSYVAARAFLHSPTRPPHVHSEDGNYYVAGTCGRHLVVVATCHTKDGTLPSAARIAKDMLKSFPEIKLFISTGTAVATPSYKEHLNLGDIVVSAGIDGIPMIPETLKNIAWDRSMTVMKVLNGPPKICLTSIWDVYIDLASEGNIVQLAMDNALSLQPGLRKKFGSQQHSLGSRELSNPRQALEEDMNEEAPNMPSPALPRQDGAFDDEKSIYYGKIASGVSTSRTAAALDECLCFTAEAEDISVEVPCLCVRSIVGAVSSRPEDDHGQGFAALRAAAYATCVVAKLDSRELEAAENILIVDHAVQQQVVNGALQPRVVQQAESLIPLIDHTWTPNPITPAWLIENRHHVPKMDREQCQGLIYHAYIEHPEFLLCLQLALFTTKPLHWQEFYHAMQHDPQCSLDLAQSHTEQCADGAMQRYITESSKGLLEVTTNGSVRLISDQISVALLDVWSFDGDPLIDLGGPWVGAGHDRVKHCCFSQIQAATYELDRHLATRNEREPPLDYSAFLLPQFPFLRYALCHLLHHANEAAAYLPQDKFIEMLHLKSMKNIAKGIAVTGGIEASKELNAWKLNPGSLLQVLAQQNFTRLMDTALRMYAHDEERRMDVDTALYRALHHGSVDAALLILRTNSNLRPILDGNMMLESVFLGLIPVVQLLLNQGVSPDVLDDDDTTPIGLALKRGYWHLSELLIDHGANIEGRDSGGRTALHSAAAGGLGKAAQFLLDRGAVMEARDDNLETPLMLAAEYGHEDVVRLLLERGAKVGERCKSHMTALDYATKYGREATIRLLVGHGNFFPLDKFDRTPLR